MTNIEKVAEQFMSMLDVYAPSKADQIDEEHWSEAKGWLIEALTTHTTSLQAELDNLEEQYKSLHERHCELLERSIETTKALLEANKRIKELEATILNEMTQIAQERG